jgi:hypothetical protein
MSFRLRSVALLGLLVTSALGMAPVGNAAPLTPFGDPYTGYATGTLVNGPAGQTMFALLANVYDPDLCGLAEGVLVAVSNTAYTLSADTTPGGLLAMDIHFMLAGNEFTGQNAPPGTTPFVDISTSVGVPIFGGVEYHHDATKDQFGAMVSATGRTHGGQTTVTNQDNPPIPFPAVASALASHTTPGYGANPLSYSLSWEYIVQTFTRQNGGAWGLADQFNVSDNGNGVNANGVNPGEILVGQAPGSTNVTIDRTRSFSFNLTQGNETIEFETVRYLRLTTECAGCVPEPSTWTLMLAGACMSLYGLRGRRSRCRR